ncbi:hypothetical protein NECAME_11770 [Necator americanus]|uniref:Uncharacterized protein n=1 Tax=Necator americanus TaxID=51031 RepID=W2T5R5_NECAM|nr:hypothetical protein NECAME_11770 [Necator americanus]ETN76292.1 hypothetical protein NECAME_11770 [Necator americanus]
MLPALLLSGNVVVEALFYDDELLVTTSKGRACAFDLIDVGIQRYYKSIVGCRNGILWIHLCLRTGTKLPLVRRLAHYLPPLYAPPSLATSLSVLREINGSWNRIIRKGEQCDTYRSTH